MTVLALIINTATIWGLNAAGGLTLESNPSWTAILTTMWMSSSILITFITRFK